MAEKTYVLKLTDTQMNDVKRFLETKGLSQTLETYDRYKAMEEAADEYANNSDVCNSANILVNNSADRGPNSSAHRADNNSADRADNSSADMRFIDSTYNGGIGNNTYSPKGKHTCTLVK